MYAFKEITISGDATNPPCPICDRAGTIDLVDGDTIPMRGKIESLRVTGGGKALSVDGYSFHAHLAFGVCNACQGESYFVNLEVIHSADVTDDWANKYFWLNERITEPSSFVRVEAALPDVPQTWFIERTPTDLGVIERHYLGPFIAEEKLSGPNGVACCGGQDTWEEAAGLIGRLWPRIALDRIPHCSECGKKLSEDWTMCKECWERERIAPENEQTEDDDIPF